VINERHNKGDSILATGDTLFAALGKSGEVFAFDAATGDLKKIQPNNRK